MKFFQRFYIFIILKSIIKYYEVNKENGQFPELKFEHIIDYFTMIKDFIEQHSIMPNEEIFLLLKNVLSQNNKKNKNNNYGKNKNNFIFQYINEENNENNDMLRDIITKDKKENKLIYNYKGQTKEYQLFLDYSSIYGMVCSCYNTFIQSNLYLEKFEKIDILLELIINIIYYLIENRNEKMARYLLNMAIILNKFDLLEYKKKNPNNENNNNKDNNNNNKVNNNYKENYNNNNENNNNNNNNNENNNNNDNIDQNNIHI